MRKTIKILMFLLVSITVFEEMSYGNSENNKKSNVINGLQLIVSFDSVVRSVNEPIWIRLEIYNISSEEKTIYTSYPGLDFHLDITRIKGDSHEPVFMTEYGRRYMDKSKGVVSIKSDKIAPGKSYSVKMNLSRLFDLSMTGTYYLSVKKTINTGLREWKDLIVENVKFTLRATKPVDNGEEKESVVSDEELEKQEPEKQEKTTPPDNSGSEKPEKIDKKEEPVEEAFPWYLVAIIEAIIIAVLALIVIKRGRK